MTTLNTPQSVASANPRQIHAGAVTRKFTYSVSASLSVGDVLELVKVPHGAIIEDVCIVRTGAGQFTGTIGDGGDADRFRTSATLVDGTVIQGINNSEGVGYQYDISDDAAVQFDTVDLTVTTVTSATATSTITGWVRYHCDEADV